MTVLRVISIKFLLVCLYKTEWSIELIKDRITQDEFA